MKIMISTKKERKIVPDIIRGIAIALVVLGHCLQYGNGTDFLENKQFFDDILYKIIYSFHMPLFMIISGFFFFFSVKKRSIREIIFNRIQMLLIPIFIWNGIFYVVHFFYNIDSAKLIPEIIQYLRSSFYTLWFLWAVLWCSLTVLLVRAIFNDNIMAYLIIFILTFITPDGFNFALYKFMYPFFVIGYLYNKHRSIIDIKLSILKGTFQFSILTFFYILLMLFYNRSTYIYVSAYTVIGSDTLTQIGTDLHRFLVGLVGSVLIIKAIFFLPKTFTASKGFLGIFSVLGVDSLGIYIISSYFNFFFLILKPKHSFNYIITILETTSILTLSYLITIVLKQFKVSNWLLLGGR